MVKQPPYDATRDFAPVSLISIGYSLLVTYPSRPYKSVKKLIALAKAEPGKLDYASAGNGSVTHLAMELFKSMAGVNITHVPYKGAPQGFTRWAAARRNLPRCCWLRRKNTCVR